MRKLILGSFLAAGLALPSLAMAKPANGLNTNQPIPNQAGTNMNTSLDRTMRPQSMPQNGPASPMGSLGGGAVGGNVAGHVDSARRRQDRSRFARADQRRAARPRHGGHAAEREPATGALTLW